MTNYTQKTVVKQFVESDWIGSKLTINHSLGSSNIFVQIWDNNNQKVQSIVTKTSPNTITIEADSPFQGKAVLLSLIPQNPFYVKDSLIKHFISSEWINNTLTIKHNFNTDNVFIQVWDNNGVEVHVVIMSIDSNHVVIQSNTPFAGQAVLIALTSNYLDVLFPDNTAYIQEFNITDWVDNSLSIYHNLNNNDIFVQVWDKEGKETHVTITKINSNILLLNTAEPFNGKIIVIVLKSREFYKEKEVLLGLIERVRMRIRDYAELNKLLDYNIESSNVFIKECIYTALEDFNVSPPLLTSFSILDFPNKTLLITGAIKYLLQGIGILTSRNALMYSDGGINVNLEKTAEYQNWLAIFSNEWEEKKNILKIALNIRSIL